MKKILFFSLILSLLFALCGCCEETVDLLPEELITLKKNGDSSYYISGGKVMCIDGDEQPQVFFENETWKYSNLWFVRDDLYALAIDEEKEDFELQKIILAEKAVSTVVKKSDIVALSNPIFGNTIGITDVVIQGNQFYFCFSLELYCLDLNSLELKRILEDVSCYQVNGENLYYIDHANRTFSIHCMNLHTGKTKTVLGNGRYVEKETDTQRYRYFVSEGDTLYFFRTDVNSLCQYKDGKETILIEAADVYEYSLFIYEGDLYYESLEKLHCYDLETNEVSEICEISDCSVPYGQYNGYWIYRDDADVLQSVPLPD